MIRGKHSKWENECRYCMVTYFVTVPFVNMFYFHLFSILLKGGYLVPYFAVMSISKHDFLWGLKAAASVRSVATHIRVSRWRLRRVQKPSVWNDRNDTKKHPTWTTCFLHFHSDLYYCLFVLHSLCYYVLLGFCRNRSRSREADRMLHGSFCWRAAEKIERWDVERWNSISFFDTESPRWMTRTWAQQWLPRWNSYHQLFSQKDVTVL